MAFAASAADPDDDVVDEEGVTPSGNEAPFLPGETLVISPPPSQTISLCQTMQCSANISIRNHEGRSDCVSVL
jgi:hypothetical protein